MKRNQLFLLIGFIVLIIVGVIILFLVTRSSSSPGSNDKKNKCIDNSDVPCPPNSLEYNATYSPPKRNCNLESSSIIKSKNINNDIVNGSYVYIDEDLDYTL